MSKKKSNKRNVLFQRPACDARKRESPCMFCFFFLFRGVRRDPESRKSYSIGNEMTIALYFGKFNMKYPFFSFFFFGFCFCFMRHLTVNVSGVYVCMFVCVSVLHNFCMNLASILDFET